jgi:tRNA pseudouridine55 synthase
VCAAAIQQHVALRFPKKGCDAAVADCCYTLLLCPSPADCVLDCRSGETLETNPWQHISDADITAAAQAFTGEVQQIPSMWSSSKYKAKPLRWYAERGEVVAREPKSVDISSIQVWRAQAQSPAAAGSSSGSSRGDSGAAISSSSSSGGESTLSDTVCFKVVASKGTSVRVLVHDLGKALGCGAHVASLRLEGLGGFSVDTAWSLEVLLPLARKYAKGFRQAQQY